MRRFLLTGTVLLATLTAMASARASVITVGATEAEFSNATGSFATADLAPLGLVGADVLAGEDRYALQFSLAALPADATVTQASLRLRDSTAARNIFAYGFAGNGVFSAASVTTGTSLFQVQTNAVSDSYDVSSFVEGLSAVNFAGFSFRQTPVGGTRAFLDGPLSAFDSPQLTITYTEPTPTTVPEPASLALLGAGVLGVGFVGKRRRKAV